MRKIRVTISIVVMLVLLLSTSIPVFAFGENEGRSIESFFAEAQILKGDGTSYGLDKNPTRMEGIILLIRILGKESEAQQLQSLHCSFVDVPSWAIGYANYAFKANISRGVSETKFGTNDPMTAQQYNTLLLRAIGYDDSLGDFSWAKAIEKADEMKILPPNMAESFIQGEPFTKRDLIEIAFCYLEAKYKGEEATMLSKLIEAGTMTADLAEEYGLAIEKSNSLTTKADSITASADSISTSAGNDEYFDFSIDKDGILSVTGRSNDPNKEWILVNVINADGNSWEKEETKKTDENGEYSSSFYIGNLPAGKYYINLYGNDEKFKSYRSFIYSRIILKITGNEYFFPVSPVYGQNIRIYKGEVLDNLDKVMSATTRKDKEFSEKIKALAAEITNGCEGDYEKVRAIHDWIAENIYYDLDFASDKTETSNIKSKDILEKRFAVCSGYSILTKDLLNAAGIPCKLIIGYALGISDDGKWEDVNLRQLEANHAWNQAYIDGRWMIIDTTWDSSNKYEGGVFTKGDIESEEYFDISLKLFSEDHKVMEIEDYMNSAI